mmetsp:Transcript_8808/g.13988  ORF Transcript_8808/g.13988 Transcript_8808/m.13988 type:complete len:346 (+) Transcript_8808:155-1192(+)
MIGQTEAKLKIPKPSAAPIPLPTPSPSDITIGTVTGPVVTPAESHATLTSSSGAGIVRTAARAYPGRSRGIRGHWRMTFNKPSAVPVPTPRATDKTTWRCDIRPLVNLCTVMASVNSAGSAKVAPKPNIHAKAQAREMPVVRPMSGEAATAGIFANSAGSVAPTNVPNCARPLDNPILKTIMPNCAAIKARPAVIMNVRWCLNSTGTLRGRESLSTIRNKNIMKATRGTSARRPATVSTSGVSSSHVTALLATNVPLPEMAGEGGAGGSARSFVTGAGSDKLSSITRFTGMREASVTTPKPVRGELLAPAPATPIPNAMTNGTVTGPVVTAPRSQARPRISTCDV